MCLRRQEQRHIRKSRMQACCVDQTFVTVNLLLGSHRYLQDVIKFQCSLAALSSDDCVQASRSGSYGCRRSVCDINVLNKSNPDTAGEKHICKRHVLSPGRKLYFNRKIRFICTGPVW